MSKFDRCLSLKIDRLHVLLQNARTTAQRNRARRLLRAAEAQIPPEKARHRRRR